MFFCFYSNEYFLNKEVVKNRIALKMSPPQRSNEVNFGQATANLEC
ncbi:hypothetical protein AsAng_0047830 [Aureispira anguillae]|uniref:Uncharacterized protein n=1 Tax=Aureispira anguillae TaxID=2864201 RepID=A0A916DVW5_9BACT|nr:hypothetical protein AsAng_0047830 [Aureispira anguillae]